MKNIHILPTDKPSRLILQSNNKFRLSEIKFKGQIASGVTQNIYITNSEEIKEGDWVIKISSLYKSGGNIQKYSFIDKEFEDITFKKIILTTDQDLIKDGVQAIDDEFLEWFINNSSCEEVEVIEQELNTDYRSDWKQKFYYKIIIPKEESKQTVQEYEQQGLEKYSYESEPKQETIYEYTENYKPSFVDLTDILPKQETLEEAAKRIYPTNIVSSDGYDGNFLCRTGFYIGYKLAQERSYSEEEVETITKDAYAMGRKGLLIGVFNKWFEQFKKK